ncbi:helix-turn-helix domain-containing protein [Nonomuraea jiangxiensis]|uniref:Helix-turn-helix domain-containing protein n=1 Tax=Nonomuraea jiangxiensis TaxID=633440 RepID=A0A1G8HM98_9ACTN|nr:helix-turn-helix domain-containing protein [Nonomuraea jiangxiensis]SDI07725.1 Helix-turn-helix domain-containing protein [Nonomuraea jiangxiensis]
MLEKVFDTEDLPPEDRLEAWHEAVSQSLTPNVFSIDRAEDFRASLRAMDLNAAHVTAMTYPSMQSRRTSKLIRRSDPELYAVALSLRGWQRLGQVGREAVLGPGDLVMYATSTPFESRVDAHEGSASSVVATIDRGRVPLPPAKLDRLLATPLPGREGMGALLAQFLGRLTTDNGSYRPADGPHLGTVLVDLFTALIAHHLGADSSVPPESRQNALILRIQAFIRQHLSDPDLSPAAIAAEHHISIRTLHRLFQSHDRTVAELIRTLRLERCRHDLGDPARADCTVRAIAARWGFSDAVTFSRAFRSAYGVSPSDYRRERWSHERP